MNTETQGHNTHSGGAFGHWITDAYGLPAYAYTCDQDRDPRAPAFTTRGPSNLHWHQIGNDRLNAICTNRGEVQVIESSRGLQWISYTDPARGCPGGGVAIVRTHGVAFTDLYSPQKFKAGYGRVFGAFYFEKQYAQNGLALKHTILAPFGDLPVLLCEVRISNTTDTAADCTAAAFFGVRLHYMSADAVVMPADRAHYGVSPLESVPAAVLRTLRSATATDTDSLRRAFGDKFRFRADYMEQLHCVVQTPRYTGRKKPPRKAASSKNYYPDSVFLAAADFTPDVAVSDTGKILRGHPDIFSQYKLQPRTGKNATPCLCLGENLKLAPGQERSLWFIYGYAPVERIPDVVEQARALVHGDRTLEAQAEKWRSRLAFFSAPGADTDWLERETPWHAAYTRTSALFDDYYQTRYLPQGGAYEYLHGFRGAVRDLALFTIPLVYTDPDLARDVIEFCMRLQSTSGRLMYANFGFGKTGGVFVHEKPSDLQLFLLWALTEYLFFTRDFAFLDREVPFYPHGAGAGTVRDRVALSLEYLFGAVGTGPHGMLRVGDGDWSDGISLFVNNRRAFVRNGESAFNTAMALYVLPRVAELLDTYNPNLAAQTRTRCHELRAAMLDAWGGKWYYRGYDGAGHPLGHDRLFLEHHVWMLIAGAVPPEQERILIKNIRELLDEPSPFGQLILYPAAPTMFNFHEKGWDVNGGVWYAINFLLTWAYARTDPARAWASLEKNSCARRAQTHPDIWYGLWSGPDAYNAHYAPRGGETYFHLPTPTTDFPVMNLNLHADFLMALIKLCGIEPRAAGLKINPRIPLEDFQLALPRLRINVSPDKIRVALPGHTDPPDIISDSIVEMGG